MAEAPLAADGAAPKPHASGGRGWWRLLVNTYKEMSKDNVGLMAAGIGFYGLLAIFPGLVVAMAIAGLVMDPASVQAQLQGLSRVIPHDAAQIILDQAVAVTGSESGGLTIAAIVAFLFAFYSASNAVQALIQGLNVAFGVTERRSLVRFYMTAFLLTIGIVVGFLAVIGLLAVVPAVLAVLPLGNFGETLGNLLRWPVLAGVVVLGLAVLYRYAPSRGPVPWRWITPGAAAATVLWLVGSVLFSVYVANFGSYNKTFGALAGVVVLLTWLWLSAFIVLMGAELDSEIERQDKLPGGQATPAEKAQAKAPPSGAATPAPARADGDLPPPHERTVEQMVEAARPK